MHPDAPPKAKGHQLRDRQGRHSPPVPQVQWSRAARTDKGVSAAANVVSLELRMLPHILDR